MKRFYKSVAVAPYEGRWRVELDGRPVKTVAGRPQAAPTRALAEAMAEEWERQGEEIDAALFALRDLADYAIDVVAPDRAAAVAALIAYAETDTLCYRAEPDEALHERQVAVWDPYLTAAEQRWDIHFERISGIIHRSQPPETIARLTGALASLDDFALSALRTLAGLSASLIIGLAALAEDADGRALWDAAHLEELWQAELWGEDAEAQARLATRFATFSSAMRFAELARS